MALEYGFLGLSILMAILLVLAFTSAHQKMGTSPPKVRQWGAILTLGLLAWFTYVFFVAKSGIMNDFTLPPKMPLMIIIPLFVFTGIVLIRNRNHSLLGFLPPSWVVYMQSFRVLVELLLLNTFLQGFIPQATTFEGYNFDILAGATAPLVAFAVFQKRWLGKKALLSWNVLGLCLLAIVVSLFISSAFFPWLWGSKTPLVTNEFVSWPYVLLPGFLMPLAVFLHFLSIVQMDYLSTSFKIYDKD